MMTFNYGFYYNEHSQLMLKDIKYTACPCKERYSFKSNCLLKRYLEGSSEWLPSIDDKYTLNYVVLSLLAIVKRKGLVRNREAVICDRELRSALGCNSFIIYEIRRILQRHLTNEEDLSGNTAPLFCVPNELVGYLDLEEQLIEHNCQNPDSSRIVWYWLP